MDLVVGPDGQYVTHYDKIHLVSFGAPRETGYFTMGEKLGVFQVGDITVGITICYDFRFTDYISSLVRRHKIDLLLHPSAFTMDGTFASWHPFMITRALEHQIFFASINRAGEDWGRSIVCPPWIDDEVTPTIFGEQEEYRMLDVTQEQIQDSRKKYPLSEIRRSLSEYNKLRS